MNAPVAIDQEARGHSADGEFLRQLPVRVEDDAKIRLVRLDEPLGIAPLAVDVDRDDHQPPGHELLLQPVHPRKGLATRSAPGSPEINVYDPALEGPEIEQVVRRGRERPGWPREQ